MSNALERTKGTAARFALSMLKPKKYADGGAVVGPLHGLDGGRTDTLPISVPSGAYVVPADVVSGLPGAQGNTLAGHNALDKLFKSLPLSPDEAPYGAGGKKLPTGRTMPGLVNQHHLMTHSLEGLAVGGRAEKHEGHAVPILAAAGEYVVHPDIVKRIGLGNLERGHSILDKFVMEVRKKHIKTLSKLPKPAKS